MAEIEKRSDDVLIALCLEKDAEAWETLVRRYQRLIATITSRYGLSPDDSADILQSVFFKVYQHLPALYKQEKLSTWITIVTVRETLKLLRKVTPETLSDGEPEKLVDLAFDQGLAQDEALLLLERQHLLRQAIAAISHPCQALLTELFYRDVPLPYAEISRQLGIPIASIGPSRARCLEKLKAELKKIGFF